MLGFCTVNTFTGSFVVVGEADLWQDDAHLLAGVCFFFLIMNISVWVSLRAFRLILRALKLTTM
jgi:hypothetical protein